MKTYNYKNNNVKEPKNHDKPKNYDKILQKKAYFIELKKKQ